MLKSPELSAQLASLALVPDEVPASLSSWQALLAALDGQYQSGMTGDAGSAPGIARDPALIGVLGAALPEGITVVDPSSGACWLNAAAQRLFGLQGERTGLEGVLQRCPLSIREGISAAFAGGSRTVFDGVRLLDLSGVESDVTLILEPVPAVDAERRWVMIAYNRQSEQKLAHELKVAQEATRAVQAARTNFLASMSHEMRTPMNGIIGMTELLVGTTLDSQQEEFVKIIQSSAEALLAVIDDILDFTKLDNGRVAVESLEFDLRQTVESVADLLAERAHQKGLELAHLIYYNVPERLIGDPTRIRQVLIKLVDNAIKFTDRGEVIIRVKLLEQAQGAVRLRFEVSDTGIGLQGEQVLSLFEPFTQGDGSSTRRFGGTGLGLSLCRRLVDLMHGQIGVESEPEKGSVFWFELPLPLGLGHSLPIVAPPQFQGKRVLIVDDNESNRAILRHQLSGWAMETVAAENGLRALELLAQASRGGKPFELVILDLMMPGIDGLQLARYIKADPLISDTPLLMLSSVGLQASLDAARAIGVNVVQTKPVRQIQLLEGIAGCLSGAGVPIENPVVPSPVAVPVTRSAAVVTAPAVPIPVPGPTPETPTDGFAPALAVRGKRVLVVEDNVVNQRVAVNMLEKLGVEVAVAGNGKVALEILERDPAFDVILMDCHMPVLDGYGATTEIRAREKLGEHVPIVALTANTLQVDRERCFDVGMDGFLAKPVKLDELKDALAPYLTAQPVAEPPAGDPTAAISLTAVGDKPDAPTVDVMTAPVGDWQTEMASVLASLVPDGVVEPGSLEPSRTGGQAVEIQDLPDAAVEAEVVEILPPLDQAVLDELSELQSEGRPDIVVELGMMFVEEAVGLLEELDAGIASSDAKRVFRSAHTLRGSAGSMGASVMAHLSEGLEARSREGDLTGAAEVSAALAGELKRVQAFLDARVG